MRERNAGDIKLQEDLSEALITHAPGGFVIFRIQEEDIIPIYESKGFYKLFNYEDEETFLKLYKFNINFMIHPKDLEAVKDREKSAMYSKTDFDMDYRVLCWKNKVKWLRTTAYRVEENDEILYYAAYTDITDIKNSELSFKEMSEKDILTNLWNRKTGMDEMAKVLKDNPNHRHAVLFIDIDNFKKINDNIGHEMGNRILVCFSEVMTELLGRSIVMRYGGDEFVALVENVTSRMSLEEKIEQICKEFMTKAERINYEASCSIGVAYTSPGISIEEVINHADEAMYDAKNCGKNAYVFYKYDEENKEALGQKLYLYDRINCNKRIERIYNGHLDNIGIIAIEVVTLEDDTMATENKILLVQRMFNNLFRKEDIYRTDEHDFLVLAANIPQRRFTEKFYDLERYFKNSGHKGIFVGASWCNNGEQIKSYITFAKNQLVAYKRNENDVAIVIDNVAAKKEHGRRIFIFNKDKELKKQLVETLKEEYELTFVKVVEDIEQDTRDYDLFLTTVGLEDSKRLFYYQKLSNKFNFHKIPSLVITDSVSLDDRKIYLEHGINAIIEQPYDMNIIKYMIDNLTELSPNQRNIHSSFFDELTFLPNATYFYELCTRLLTERSKEEFSLVFFDVEKFKTFNDVNGFEAGNEFIVEIAKVISEEFNGSIIARMGDDHFTVFAKRQEFKQAIQQVYERIYHNSYGFPMHIKAGIYHMGKGDTINLAYDRAKLTCDNIKNEYDVIYSVYTDAFRERLLKEKKINDKLNKAIVYKHLKVFYQPVIRTASQKICGFESLVRWDDPEMGFLSPATFIPTLEKNRTINRLDIFVINQVCEDIQKFREKHHMRIPISINLSQLDFELCDIYEEVCAATQYYNVPHHMIHIEITESAMNSQSDKMIATVERFREAGFEIWIDDFGSEYSSLNSLKNFKLDVLKLDMKFLENFEYNENAKKIVSAVIDMAKEIGCRTVSEGVEKLYEFEFLKKIGCDKIQGYYFYKPMPYEETLKLSNFETEEEKLYYDELGKINYQSTTLLAEKDESMFATLNAPLSIQEIEDDKLNILYSSQSYYETVETLNLHSVETVESIVNNKESELYQKIREPIYRTLASGNFEKLDFWYGEIPCRIVCKRITKTKRKGAFYVLLYNTAYMDNLQKNEDINDYVGFLCDIYERVDFIDYKNDKIGNVYLNSQYLSNLFEGTTVLEGAVGFAKDNIVEQDRKEFLEFYDEKNVTTYLSGVNQHYIGDIFRVIDPDGGVKWQLFTIVKIKQKGETSYLSCVRDFKTIQNKKVLAYNDSHIMEVLNFINDGAVIIQYQDGEGYIQYANNALLGMLQAKFSDLVGHSCRDMLKNVVEEDRQIATDMLTALKSRGSCMAVYRFTDFSDQKTVWLLANGKYLKNSHEEMAYITFSDVSVQLERVEREQRFSHCLQLINMNSNFDANGSEIMENIREYYDADRTYIFEFVWEHNLMSNTYECIKEGVTAEIENLKDLPINLIMHWLPTFNEGKAVVIPDVDELKKLGRNEEYDILKPQNVKNLMVAPIFYENQLYGYMGVDNPKQNNEDEEFLINLTLFISKVFYERKMKKELYQLSYYDALTTLKNRNAYKLLWTKNPDQVLNNAGIAFLDINGLKNTNDTKGHLIGDKLIKETADLIKKHFSAEWIYRISGDEFVIVVENIEETAFEKVMLELERDLEEHGNIAAVGYTWKAYINNIERVFNEAEVEMYKGKREYYTQNPEYDRRKI